MRLDIQMLVRCLPISVRFQRKLGRMKTTSKCLVLCLVMFASFAIIGLSRSSNGRILVYTSPYCQCERKIPVRATVDENTIHWCSEESSLRGYNQNVVGYSLYGDSINAKDNKTSRYYMILDSIPHLVRQSYGWQIRLYHNIMSNQSREKELLCKMYCENDNVDLCDVNQMIDSFEDIRTRTKKSVPISGPELARFNRMNWRYLPMLDPLVDRLLARDLDSEINDREIAAVNQWLDSDYTFHVMRDHPGHKNHIMGGMFGIKIYQERSKVNGLMRAMVHQGTSHGFGFDQSLLATLFWPTVKDDAMIHDSYWCEKDWNSLPIHPFPTRRDQETHAFVTDRNGSNWPRPGECPVACRPSDHQDWEDC